MTGLSLLMVLVMALIAGWFFGSRDDWRQQLGYPGVVYSCCKLVTVCLMEEAVLKLIVVS
jgi:hypothetical protein